MKEGSDRFSQVKRFSGAAFCVECGRCVAVCPMAEMYGNFSIEMSPRGVVQKALREGAEMLGDENLWYCTECNAGTDVCPQGVSCRDLVRGLREIALEEGKAGTVTRCRCCGKPFVALPVERFVLGRLEGEPENVLALLEYCPFCRRAVYFRRNA
jgi:heterodisulfide reductase subunit C